MIKQIFGKLPRKPSKSLHDDSNGDGGINALNSSRVANGNPVLHSLNSDRTNQGKKKPLDDAVQADSFPPSGIYEVLPSFRDVHSSEKSNLFIKKLQMCCVVFDFSDPSKNLREKEIKRQTLIELVDYIATVLVKFNDMVMQEMIEMVGINLFRTNPSRNHDNNIVEMFDMEEDEAELDPAWPHLQVVYELLLRFVASPMTDAKLAKRYIDHSFILRLLDLFDSEDQREREYLKMILHRIYGKFMVHRPFIRKAINNTFYRFIFETEKHNGIAELLEILGSIINGFALPLKEEHKLFLIRALIPLHKPKCASIYHQQLSYCIVQFVEKDFKLSDIVIRGLLRYWPLTNSSKQVMFLGELEEVLEVTQTAEFQRFMVPLFCQIARCLNSSHFQVAERALFLWNNDHIRNLITENHKVIMPIILPALEKNTRGHWNQAVQNLTMNVRKVFIDTDQVLFDECLTKFQENEAKENEIEAKRKITWMRLEELAASKAVNNEAEAVLIPRFISSITLSNESPRSKSGS